MSSEVNASDLRSLLERVEKATGPDRELDRSIFLSVIAEPIPSEGMFVDWIEDAFPGKGHILPTVERSHHIAGTPTDGTGAPNYTASVDAALALVEREVPEWVVADLSQNSRHAGDPWGCTLACYCGSTPSKNRSASSGYDYPKPALAILAALLKALIARAEQ